MSWSLFKKLIFVLGLLLAAVAVTTSVVHAAPAAPTGLSFSVSGSNANISWNSTLGASSYRVFVSDVQVATDVVTNSFTLNTSAWRLDRMYKIQVSAVDESGESDKSAFVLGYRPALGQTRFVIAGSEYSAAIKSDGKVTVWGRGGSVSKITGVPSDLTNVVGLSASNSYHILALKSDGTVVCWGNNTNNQCNVPAGLNNVVQVVSANTFSLALKADGTVVAWGTNTSGATTVPANATNIISIAAGYNHVLALKQDGTLVGWGNNANGQTTTTGITNVKEIGASINSSFALLNTGTITRFGASYTMTAGLTGIAQIASSGGLNADYVYAVKTDGTVVSVGNGHTVKAGLSNVIALSVSSGHVFAYKGDGTFESWSLDTNLYNQNNFPGWLSNVKDIVIHEYTGAALRNDGTVVAWGYNETVNRPSTVPAGLSNVRKIVAGREHFVALKEDGTLVIWGYYKTLPAALTGKTVVDVTAGAYHTVAALSDGTVVAWGDNSSGQTNVPAGLTDVVDVEAGYHHTLALKRDGSVVAWGRNNETQTNVPIGISNVVQIAALLDASFALLDNGTIVPWGSSGHHAVPSGYFHSLKTLNYKPAGLATGVGHYHLNVLKPDGTVESFGSNNYGTAPWTSMGVPAGLTDVVKVTMGVYNNLALKRDGTVVTWGSRHDDGALVVFQGNPNSLLAPIVTVTAGDRKVDLNWNAVSGASGYDVYINGVKHNASLIETSSYTISGLSNNQLVKDITVVAVNGQNRSAPSVATSVFPFDNVGPSAPSELSATSVSPTTANLTWTASSDVSSATSRYEIFINEVYRGFSTTNSFVLSGLAPNQSYLVKINAVDSAGNKSAFSDMMSVTTISHQSTILSAPQNVLYNGTTGTVSWNSVASATSYAVYINDIAVATGVSATSYVLNTTDWEMKRNYKLQVSAWNQSSESVKSNLTFAHKPTPDGREIRDLSAGYQYTVLLRRNGTITGWGNGAYYSTTSPTNLTNGIAIESGYGHVLGLKSDGNVEAWGMSTYGQIAIPQGVEKVVKVAAGDFHSLALTADGTVIAWGRNNYNQSIVPVGLTDVVDIAAGSSYSAALKRDGTIVTWGKYYDTTLGVFVDLVAPPSLTNVRSINAGNNYLIALTTTERVVVFGDRYYSNLTPAAGANQISYVEGSMSDSNLIVALRKDGRVVFWPYSDAVNTVANGLTNIVQITVGYSSFHALNANGTIHSYSNNSSFREIVFPGWTQDIREVFVSRGSVVVRKGDNTFATWGYSDGNTNTAFTAANLTSVKKIISYDNYLLSLRSDGTVRYNGGATNIPASATNVVDIDVGNNFGVALKNDGTVVVWTLSSGVLWASVPAGITDVVQIEAGGSHVMFLKGDGTVLSYGTNNYGQATVPEGLNNIIQVSAGESYSLALKADGTVVGWGRTDLSSLNFPNNLFNVIRIEAGINQVLALKSDGSVLNWGSSNNYGERTLPSNIANVSSIYNHNSGEFNMALLRDGTLTGWGRNSYSQRNHFNGTPNSLLIPFATITPDEKSAIVSWGAVPGATKYNVYMNGVKLNASDLTGTSYTITGLTNNRVYNNITVTALNGTFETPNSSPLSVIPKDLSPPTVPNGLASSELASTRFSVSWNASTDSGSGTKGYVVFLNGIRIDFTSSTQYSFSGLTASTMYSVTVRSVDQNDNLSAASNVLQVTTTSPATPVSSPSNLTFTISGSSPVVTWSAVPSATRYFIYVNHKLHATNGNTTTYTFNAANWSLKRLYKVQVTAVAGNEESSRSTAVYAYKPSTLETRQIEAAYYFTSTVKSNGYVVSWGDITGSGRTNVPTDLGPVIAVEHGQNHILALKPDGTVRIWGSNFYYQTLIPPGLNDVVQIATSHDHNLALKADGTVMGWGRDDFGQSTVPAGLQDIISVSTGLHHSIALKADGTVVAWGRNQVGQLDIPFGLKNVIEIAAGPNHNLALKSDGTVVAWGDNSQFQSAVPPTATNIIAIDASPAGYNTSVVLKSNGTVLAWGRGTTSNFQTHLNPPAGLNNVVQITASSDYIFVLKADGTYVSWGNGASNSENYFPGWLGNIRDFYTNGYITQIFKQDGSMENWGYGQISAAQRAEVGAIKTVNSDNNIVYIKSDGTVVASGSANTGVNSVPAGLTNVVDVSVGTAHALALKSDGTVVAWGPNTLNYSNLGQSNVPAGLSNVVKVAAGLNHSVALKSDGTVVTWGSNSHSQLNVPANLTGVIDIAVGDYFNVALKSDGTVVCWGHNDVGQCTVPTGLKDVVQVTAGVQFAMALKGDGTVVRWPSAVPAQAASDVIRLSSSGYVAYHTGVLKADRTLYLFGNAGNGRTANFAVNPVSLKTPIVHVTRGDTRAFVNWTAVPGAIKYNVYMNGVKQNPSDITGTSYTITGLTNGTMYRNITVTALDNTTETLPSGPQHVIPFDNSPPTVPDGFTVTERTSSSFRLNWNASTDFSAVAGYEVYRNDALLGTTSSPTFLVTGLVEYGSYTMRVVAYDTTNNKSAGGVILVKTSDLSPPSQPTGLTVVTKSNSSIKVSYNASTDNFEISGYEIFVNGVAVGSTNLLQYTINGLQQYTTYTITIKSVDGDSNRSISSDALVTRTLYSPPQNFQFQFVAGEPTFSWDAISGASSYHLYVNGALHTANISNSSHVMDMSNLRFDRKLKVQISVNKTGEEGALSDFILAYRPQSDGIRNLVAGSGYSVANYASGKVVAYGKNQSGQLMVPSELSDVIAVSVGEGHVLALKKDGSVTAWGKNTSGQATVPETVANAIMVSAGANHSLALLADGSVIAWGLNTYNQTVVPTFASPVRSISAGSHHSLALLEDGTVVGWGLNSSGQISSPAALDNVVEIAAGSNHSLALKSNGIVVAWGSDSAGQSSIPNGLINVKAIDADLDSGNYSLALKTDGTVVGWGSNLKNQISVPDGLSDVASISAGFGHTLALKNDGTVVGWGENGFGERSIHAAIRNTIDAATGPEHSVAVSGSGLITVWGSNLYGQINISNQATQTVKVASSAKHVLALQANGIVLDWGFSNLIPPGLNEVADIAAGEDHFLALKTDGTVVAWGDNSYGQANVPAGLEGVVAIAAGAHHSLALRSNGTVVAWGRNQSGQTSVPNGLQGVHSIAAGSEHSLALKFDGTISAWGSNAAGQLNAPTSGNIIGITAGAQHSLLLQADGTVIAWGSNNQGQSTVPQNLSNVVKLISSAISNHTIAIRNDGTMLAWGSNANGQAITFNGNANELTAPSVSIATTSNKVILTWSPIAGASEYDVYIGGIKHNASEVTANSYEITGLKSNFVNNRIYVRAKNSTSASIPSASFASILYDDVLPVTPMGLFATDVEGTSIRLNWEDAEDDVAISDYLVYVNGQLVGTSGTTTYLITGLSSYTVYQLTVKSRDMGGNVSPFSNALQVRTMDIIAPIAPATLMAQTVTASSFNLVWTASTDNGSGVNYYNVYKDGIFLASTSNLALSITDLTLGTEYSMSVRAVDNNMNISISSLFLSVTTVADITPPQPPQGLRIEEADKTSIAYTVAWDAAYDNTMVDKYDVYKNGILVATTTGTSYRAEGLMPDTMYTWTIISTDVVGLTSNASQPLYARTPTDRTKPIPAQFTEITNKTTTSFTLNWDGASDDGVISKYELYTINRLDEYVLVGSTTDLFYTMTDAKANTWLRFALRTVDSKNNKSNYSRVLLIKPSNDLEAPTVPTQLMAQDIKSSSFLLKWTASTDNRDVTGYEVYFNNKFYSFSEITEQSAIKLQSDTLYVVKIRAIDAYDNKSDFSEELEVRTLEDVTPPTTPQNVTVSGTNSAGFMLRWNHASDDVAIKEYRVLLNGVTYPTKTKQNRIKITGLQPLTLYTVQVVACDPTELVSAASAIIQITTSRDSTRPTPADKLSISHLAPTSFTLNWIASTDNVAVTGYEVYLNDEKIGTTANTYYAVAGLKARTQYELAVVALDGSGNRSARSNRFRITTLTDITPPSQPQNLVVSSIEMSRFFIKWSPSTDNRMVAGYRILINDVLLEKTTETKFVVNSLLPNTIYKVKVVAFDLSGNLSTASEEKQVTTLVDSLPPSIPTELYAMSLDGSQYLLTWRASKDNVKVSKYQILVEGVHIDLSLNTNYQLVALEPNRTYAVQVAAIDDAGNVSQPSSKLIISTNVQTHMLGPNVNLLLSKPNLIDSGRVNVNVGVGSDSVLGLSLYNHEKQVVKSFYSNRITPSGEVEVTFFATDDRGARLPSGAYTFALTARQGTFSRNIFRTVWIDMELPEVTELQVSNDLTSISDGEEPAEGSTTTISYKLAEAGRVFAVIRNPRNQVEYIIHNGTVQSAGEYSYDWSGIDYFNQTLADGRYSVVIYVLDFAGRKSATYTTRFNIERAKPFITSVAWKDSTFKPRLSARNILNFTLSERSTVQVKLFDSENNLLATIYKGLGVAGENKVFWNGANTAGQLLPAGTYTYKISAVDPSGNEADEFVGTIVLN